MTIATMILHNKTTADDNHYWYPMVCKSFEIMKKVYDPNVYDFTAPLLVKYDNDVNVILCSPSEISSLIIKKNPWQKSILIMAIPCDRDIWQFVDNILE